MDTVAHCGGNLDGDHVWTLTLTDIDSGWTCLRAVWNRGQHGVLGAVREVEAALPFKLLGLRESMEGADSCALTLDSDNGGEFINQHLHTYLQGKQTRGQPYHKNDNAHVEQKNWTHARQLLGYERLGQEAAVPLINALCVTWELLQNYFCPSMKLLEKQREGAKVSRRHDAAATPCDRLLASTHLSAAAKARLRATRAKLNPFDLSRQVEQQLRAVWRANRPQSNDVLLARRRADG